MKLSEAFWLASFTLAVAGIVTEALERKRGKKRETSTWEAALDGKDSSSSQQSAQVP
jgi:hypothetical protein